jgi:hypothetical protein
VIDTPIQSIVKKYDDDSTSFLILADVTWTMSIFIWSQTNYWRSANVNINPYFLSSLLVSDVDALWTDQMFTRGQNEKESTWVNSSHEGFTSLSLSLSLPLSVASFLTKEKHFRLPSSLVVL